MKYRHINKVRALGMRYAHDCAECIPLGQMGDHDLYFCSQGRPTVIARYGDDGPEYRSGICFTYIDPELARAYALAVDRGLLANDKRQCKSNMTKIYDTSIEICLGSECEEVEVDVEHAYTPADPANDSRENLEICGIKAAEEKYQPIVDLLPDRLISSLEEKILRHIHEILKKRGEQ